MPCRDRLRPRRFAALSATLLGITNALVAMIHRLEQAPDAAATAKAWQVFLAGLAEGPAPLVVAFALRAAPQNRRPTKRFTARPMSVTSFSIRVVSKAWYSLYQTLCRS